MTRIAVLAIFLLSFHLGIAEEVSQGAMCKRDVMVEDEHVTPKKQLHMLQLRGHAKYAYAGQCVPPKKLCSSSEAGTGFYRNWNQQWDTNGMKNHACQPVYAGCIQMDGWEKSQRHDSNRKLRDHKNTRGWYRGWYHALHNLNCGFLVQENGQYVITMRKDRKGEYNSNRYKPNSIKGMSVDDSFCGSPDQDGHLLGKGSYAAVYLMQFHSRGGKPFDCKAPEPKPCPTAAPTPAPTLAPASCSVSFFIAGGEQITIEKSHYHLNDLLTSLSESYEALSDFNTMVVKGQCKVTLYTELNFKGISKEFGIGTHTSMAGKWKSIRIFGAAF